MKTRVSFKYFVNDYNSFLTDKIMKNRKGFELVTNLPPED